MRPWATVCRTPEHVCETKKPVTVVGVAVVIVVDNESHSV